MATEERQPGDRAWSLLLLALVVAPLVVSAFVLWFSVGRDYHPPADLALLELRTRDALHHGVLSGPYSRFGWNHPGPLLFYVLAVPYRLLGSRSISLEIGALVVNALTIVTMTWVAYRRGALPMVIATLVPVGLLMHAFGPDLVRNPWNPYLPVLPLLVLLLLAWSVAVGDLWMLPLAAAVASFIVQSHVGLAPAAFAFVLVAAVGVAVRAPWRRSADRRSWWYRFARVVAVSLVVVAVLWLPVAYDTVVRGDGNLGQIADFFTQSHRTAGLDTALRVLGLQWGPRPVWIFGQRASGIGGYVVLEPHWWLAVWLLLGVVATAVAARRHATGTVWFAAVVGAGLAIAVLSVGNIVGSVFSYLIQWTWVLGAALGMLVLQAVWVAVPAARRASARRAALAIAAVGLGVLAVVEIVNAATAGTPFSGEQAQERTLTREVLDHLPPGPGAVMVRTAAAAAVAPGVVLALERHGIRVEVSPSEPRVYGARRNSGHGPYRAELTVVEGTDAGRDRLGGARRIAYYRRARSPESERAIRTLLAALEAAHTAGRDAQIRSVRRQLRAPAEQVAVFLADRSTGR